MLHTEVENTEKIDHVMFIDLDRCVGCHTCAVACKLENNTPMGIWWNRVLTIGGEGRVGMDDPEGVYPHLRVNYIPYACQHCDRPPCIKVCPTGATYKREDGNVVIDYERCIGCRYCMAACPYGVRTFNWGEGKHVPTHAVGYQDEHNDKLAKDKRVVYKPVRPVGVVEKCSFCVQRVDNGQVPFCIGVCPGRARVFGKLADPNSEVAELWYNSGFFTIMEELNTAPDVFFIPPRKKGPDIQKDWITKLSHLGKDIKTASSEKENK